MPLTIDDMENCASLAREVNDIRERLARIHSNLERTTPVLREQPGSGAQPKDKLCEGIVLLDTVERMYAKKISKHLSRVVWIEKAMDTLTLPMQRSIVRLYYIDGLTWDELADKVHYSVKQCQRMRDRALQTMGVDLKRGCR